MSRKREPATLNDAGEIFDLNIERNVTAWWQDQISVTSKNSSLENPSRYTEDGSIPYSQASDN